MTTRTPRRREDDLFIASPAHERTPASVREQVDPEQTPESLEAYRRCTLWHDATQAVPGAGSTHATLMLVGEQPGDQEDQASRPFVGPAGALLDTVLAEAGIERKAVYVTNAVKHFKWELRGKRRLHKTPAQREVEACSYWLERELAKVRPKVVVALGATALQAVLRDPKARLAAHRDRVTHIGDLTVVATWHPSYVLRAPSAQARKTALAQMIAALLRAHALTGQS
ncbi:UdgX family uracil-DNA binding protein [Paraburkholderia silvatlantica]|uniref:Type-4 uracil-DNA glycosylase n=1 Tax=Paraburkholderia silvatlantica TaxID=321895 RepID=A0A2V4SYE0_9BURK|nr:UdgX family uracil-DNA binding protein [Paraburkholderia silvatlantica]PYE13634.1 DNA polymerase [Paraburkholderia silvatlantica]TDQ81585.1 DNA polymerase [Paraburkholderia silvatlantica]